MVYINEWLPNPAGSDAQGEFVELYNNGNSPVDLSGWLVKTRSGKTKLNSTIGAGEYLVLKRSTTKLVLKNTDEKLFLYSTKRNLVDQSGFFGAAPSGKSFSRTGYESGSNNQSFMWSDPTPGAKNIISLNIGINRNIYPSGIPLNKNLGQEGLWIVALSSALILSALISYAVKKHENLSKLLFGRDEEIR